MLASVERNFIAVANDQLGRVDQNDDRRHTLAEVNTGTPAIEPPSAPTPGKAKLVPDSISPSAAAVPGAIRKYGAVSGIPLPVNSANMSFRSATTFAAVAPVLAICRHHW